MRKTQKQNARSKYKPLITAFACHETQSAKVNEWDIVDDDYYKTQLSVVLKVRAMENYCAVILKSKNMNKCYQCGQNRTAQVVKSENGLFGIDLSRTGGPETIWRNKDGMKAAWRENIEWLIESLVDE